MKQQRRRCWLLRQGNAPPLPPGPVSVLAVEAGPSRLQHTCGWRSRARARSRPRMNARRRGRFQADRRRSAPSPRRRRRQDDLFDGLRNHAIAAPLVHRAVPILAVKAGRFGTTGWRKAVAGGRRARPGPRMVHRAKPRRAERARPPFPTRERPLRSADRTRVQWRSRTGRDGLRLRVLSGYGRWRARQLAHPRPTNAPATA